MARPVILLILALLAGAVEAATRQGELCGNGRVHTASYCPAVLSSPSSTSVTSSGASCRASSNVADGTQYVCATTTSTPLTAAQVAACTGGTAVVGNSAPVSGSGVQTVAVTGLTASTGYYCQSVNRSPELWYSNVVVSPQFTTAASGAQTNAERIAAFFVTGETPHFSYTTPTDPSTNQTINVTAGDITSLRNAIATANARVIVPAGTYNGALSTWANDVDVVMDNAAIVNGNVDFASRARIRITGGRFNGGHFNAGGTTSDMLFDNVRIEGDGRGTANENGNNWLGSHNRIAWVNTTINYLDDQAGNWGIFTLQGSNNNDWFILGSSISSSFTAVRLQNVTGVVIADSVFQPAALGSVGMRFNVAVNVLWRDVLNRGGIHMNFSQDGGGTPDVGNLRSYRLRKYHSQSSIGFTNANSSGEVYDSEMWTTGGSEGAPASITPFTGTNNLIRAWNGSTFPDTSGYGADH